MVVDDEVVLFMSKDEAAKGNNEFGKRKNYM
jgi:hypothetical protein